MKKMISSSPVMLMIAFIGSEKSIDEMHEVLNRQIFYFAARQIYGNPDCKVVQYTLFHINRITFLLIHARLSERDATY